MRCNRRARNTSGADKHQERRRTTSAARRETLAPEGLSGAAAARGGVAHGA
jgi:hypothetical protein